MANESRTSRLAEFFGLVAFAAALMLLIALATFHPGDPALYFKAGASGPARNFIGPVGAFFAELLIPQLFGMASVLIPLVLGVLGWKLFWCRPIEAPYTKCAGLTLLLVSLTAFLSLAFDGFVLVDTHWFTTLEWVLNAHPRLRGLYTSEERPEMLHEHRYDYPGDPELAATIAETARGAGLRAVASAHQGLPMHYPTLNVMSYFNPDAARRVLTMGVCQTTSVDNDLEVRDEVEEQQLAEADQDFLQKVKDATTTAQVKTKLIGNENVSAGDIDVDTDNSVVRLSGAVRSDAERQLAELIARNTAGVKSVDNELEIRRSG